jgi:hypothetical protein
MMVERSAALAVDGGELVHCRATERIMIPAWAWLLG